MVLEAARRLSCGQIPQAKSLVPRARECIVAVRRENDVADEVRVTVETLLGNTIAVVFAHQTPDDQCLVCKIKFLWLWLSRKVDGEVE